MDRVEGRVAVVTGAAGGIGRGMAEVLAEAGMKVVLADVEEAALAKTAEELAAAGHHVHAVPVDVTRAESVEALAKEAIGAFERVHVVCNNAGVGSGGGLVWEVPLDDWEWVLDVNLRGVIHGIRSFVPHMIEHGEPAHVVNTASLAGLLAGAGEAPYAVSKFGVVALSETLYAQLQQARGQVSASVLCPGFVRTNILESERNRPEHRGESRPLQLPKEPVARAAAEWFQQQIREGMEPRVVGEKVLQAILEERFYILTHPDWNVLVEKRMRRIVSGKNPRPEPPPGFQEALVAILKRVEAGES